MKKLLSTVLGALIASVVVFSGVSAVDAGQIEAGDIYRVRNVTNGTDFMDPASATCGNTVQFKVRIHNIGAYPLQSVKVAATLPAAKATTHSSTVTVSASNANAKTDNAVVNSSEASTLSYIAGSTELLDAHNGKLSTLPDGIVSGGVTLPDPIGVSTEQKRFVQFSAKVNCETPPKKIKVCELATKKIIEINEADFDASKHSKDLSKCKEVPPVKIKVCELSTKKIIYINEKDFDASKHSKDLSKCKEEVKKIKVCELSTKKVIVINEKDFDSSKHSKNLNDCKETPVPGKLTVCEISTKEVITINENEFDAAKHSKNLDDCAEVLGEETEETPEVIPSTGPTAILAQVLGAGSLAAAGTAYVRSRKLLG